MLFLDTEFLQTKTSNALLSLALVSDECEFYAEVQHGGRLTAAKRSRFHREHVLPQLSLASGAILGDESEIALRIHHWLKGLRGDPIEVAYDYSVDFTLLEGVLSLIQRPPPNLIPVHIGYLLEDAAGEAAAVASWSAIKVSRGLARHHALADALALKARFEAVHGSTA